MNKTIQSLILKVKNPKNKMPSLNLIHRLLDDNKIKHRFIDSINVAQSKTVGRTYINYKRYGKTGKKLEINHNGVHIKMDTSSSYYSYNSYFYAVSLLKLLNIKY